MRGWRGRGGWGGGGEGVRGEVAGGTGIRLAEGVWVEGRRGLSSREADGGVVGLVDISQECQWTIH